MGDPFPPGNDESGASLVGTIFNPSAANWLLLNFDGDLTLGQTPGTATPTASTVALTLGANPDFDLSGTITGFGIYRDLTGGNNRFDTFTIAVVPEPTSFALLGLGTLALLFRRRLA